MDSRLQQFGPDDLWAGVQAVDGLPDYYELLGLPYWQPATEDVVLRHAREVRERLTPYFDSEHAMAARTLVERLQEACATLTDSERRRVYNTSLRAQQLLRPETRTEHRRRWRGTPESHEGAPAASLSTQDLTAAPTPVREVRDGTDSPTGSSTSNEDRTDSPTDSSTSNEDRTGSPSDEESRRRPRGETMPARHPSYHVLCEISRGQNSVVYEAYERTLGRSVAIKQLVTCGNGGSREAELFWQEARFLAELRHEHVVSVYAVDVQRKWIIMERMKGSLHELLPRGPFDPDLVRSLLRQALEGLKYLHGKGKIHGEIKPSRLLIDSQGCLRISHSPGRTLDGEFRMPARNQHHVAPELLKPDVFGDMGPALDLYCLAFVALEMLVGPGLGKRLKGIEANGKQGEFAWLRWHSSPSECLPDIRELAPNAPDDLVFVLQSMTKKYVDERYNSAQSVLDDLENSPLVLVNLADQVGSRKGTGTMGEAGTVRLNAPANLVPKRKLEPTRPNAVREWLIELWQNRLLLARSKRHRDWALGIGLMVLLIFVLLSAIRPERNTGNSSSDPVDPSLASAGARISSDEKSPTEDSSEGETRVALPIRDDADTQPVETAAHRGLVPPDVVGPKISSPSPESADPDTTLPAERGNEQPRPTGRVLKPEWPPQSWYYLATQQEPWPLPDRLSRQQQEAYVREVQEMLDAVTRPDDAAAKRAAQEHYEKAYDICESDPRAHFALALVLMDQCRNREAQPYLIRSVDRAGNTYLEPHRQLLFNMAVQFQQDELAAECVQFLQQLLSVQRRRTDDDPVIWYNVQYVGKIMGWLDWLGGQTQARQICEEPVLTHFLEQHPRAVDYYLEARNSAPPLAADFDRQDGNPPPTRRQVLEQHIPLNFSLEAHKLLKTFPAPARSVVAVSSR